MDTFVREVAYQWMWLNIVHVQQARLLQEGKYQWSVSAKCGYSSRSLNTGMWINRWAIICEGEYSVNQIPNVLFTGVLLTVTVENSGY